MLKTTLLAAAGAAAGCYLAWRRHTHAAGGPQLAPGLVIDPSKAKAILDLGKEVVGASVEQAINGKLGTAA